jgi:hypothetical protein
MYFEPLATEKAIAAYHVMLFGCRTGGDEGDFCDFIRLISVCRGCFIPRSLYFYLSCVWHNKMEIAFQEFAYIVRQIMLVLFLPTIGPSRPMDKLTEI